MKRAAMSAAEVLRIRKAARTPEQERQRRLAEEAFTNSPAGQKFKQDLQRWRDEIRANPNADGWIRLVEILREAKNDERVASSAGAMSFTELMLDIAEDSLTLSTADAAVQPLIDLSDEGIGYKKYRKTQAAKGILGAEVRWADEDRGGLNEIVCRLASLRDEMGDYINPADLWMKLLGDLDCAGANPFEQNSKILKDASVIYGRDRNSYTYDAFRKQVGRIRKRWDMPGL